MKQTRTVSPVSRGAGDEVTSMRQQCDRKVEQVVSDRDILQVRLDSTALQLSGARNSLTEARERLGHLRRFSAASHLRPELLLASSVYRLVDRVAFSGMTRSLFIVRGLPM